jgi:hypothetical protein
MTKYHFDKESFKANQWFLTRAELSAWLLAIFDDPFVNITRGKNASWTRPSMQSWELVFQISDSMPAVTAETDPAQWAREALTTACMGGVFDEYARSVTGALVLRWTVLHMKTHARLGVKDAIALLEDAAGTGEGDE